MFFSHIYWCTFMVRQAPDTVSKHVHFGYILLGAFWPFEIFWDMRFPCHLGLSWFGKSFWQTVCLLVRLLFWLESEALLKYVHARRRDRGGSIDHVFARSEVFLSFCVSCVRFLSFLSWWEKQSHHLVAEDYNITISPFACVRALRFDRFPR